MSMEDNYEDRINELESKIDDLKEQINLKDEELKETQGKLDIACDFIEDIRRDVNDKARELGLTRW